MSSRFGSTVVGGVNVLGGCWSVEMSQESPVEALVRRGHMVSGRRALGVNSSMGTAKATMGRAPAKTIDESIWSIAVER
jgi:hypothetical protein